MGFHSFSAQNQGWFWQAVVHYIEAWKKWPGLCWWRILATKNNGGKERLVCLDDFIGTSFFFNGALGKIIFFGVFLLEDFSAIDEFTTIYCSFLGDFFLLPRFQVTFSPIVETNHLYYWTIFFWWFRVESGETMAKCIAVHSGKRYFLTNHLQLYGICGICECICRS